MTYVEALWAVGVAHRQTTARVALLLPAATRLAPRADPVHQANMGSVYIQSLCLVFPAQHTYMEELPVGSC